MADTDAPDSHPPVRELSRPQRRVLGTLLEKGFTTPDQYPLTLKAVTTGCNQKNNRDPVSNYSEDQVLEVLDQLQQMGLVAVVHTESGRTERYRHYARKRFSFTEPQLAIITELLLRGRQSLGELRTRASRMVPIESLDDLRTALQGLLEDGCVEADMPLDRRGAEVDHGFYSPGEKRRVAPERIATQSEGEVFGERYAAVGVAAPAREGQAAFETELGALRRELQATREELDALRLQFADLNRDVGDMRRQLGG